MTFADWLTFRFSTTVEMEGELSVEAALSSLGRITAPPFSFAKNERRKPFRGTLDATPLTLRWPINQRRFMSPRTLRFIIEPQSQGSHLVGSFHMWLAYRVIVMLWMYACVGFNLLQILIAIIHDHQSFRDVKLQFWALLLGPVIAYGYTGIVLLVGRRREGDLLRAAQATVKNEEQAAAVRSLLMG